MGKKVIIKNHILLNQILVLDIKKKSLNYWIIGKRF